MTYSTPQDWKPPAGTVIVGHRLARTNLGNEFRNIYELTLSDDTLAYGCAHCPEVGATWQKIAARHLREAHGLVSNMARKKVGRRPNTTVVDSTLLDMPLRDILALAAKAMEGSEAGQDWKQRAKAAERKLGQLRSALSG